MDMFNSEADCLCLALKEEILKVSMQLVCDIAQRSDITDVQTDEQEKGA